jgi:hypothetical protein
VQIWSLLKRVGFEGWIRTIQTNLPWTRRVANVVRLPGRLVGVALRPFRLPFYLRAQAAQAAREAAEREAAVATARNSLFSRALRTVHGAASFGERKLRGAAGSVGRAVGEVVVR